MKTLLCLALIAILLSGCVALPAAPVVTEVKIPVTQPCTEPLPSKPPFAVDALELGAPIDAQMRALRAERRQRIGYEIELEAAAKACR
ncbi:MAG: hypothetical protein AB1642_13475 [Pseudomonadota bacterium]